MNERRREYLDECKRAEEPEEPGESKGLNLIELNHKDYIHKMREYLDELRE